MLGLVETLNLGLWGKFIVNVWISPKRPIFNLFQR